MSDFEMVDFISKTTSYVSLFALPTIDTARTKDVKTCHLKSFNNELNTYCLLICKMYQKAVKQFRQDNIW